MQPIISSKRFGSCGLNRELILLCIKTIRIDLTDSNCFQNYVSIESKMNLRFFSESRRSNDNYSITYFTLKKDREKE